jgi:hypothetical protein
MGGREGMLYFGYVFGFVGFLCMLAGLWGAAAGCLLLAIAFLMVDD